jgi:DNA-binding protein Fis
VRRLSAEETERRYLEEVLRRARGNLSRAAELSGISRQSLTNLANKHGLHPRGE